MARAAPLLNACMGPDAEVEPSARPLAGRRIGVTAARKVTEQVALLERRGAEVVCAPALSQQPGHVDEASLRSATEEVVGRPVDLFLATTGIGMRTWFAAADTWGLGDRLVATLARAEVLARGPKSVGALRRRGLDRVWSPASERFADVLERLDDRSLEGVRVVLQEHGQSLTTTADELRARGALVTVVTVYRVEPAEEPEPLRRLLGLVADRDVDAVTFTSAPAVEAFMRAAADAGRADAVVAAFAAGAGGGGVVASCVGPVTADAFEPWGVPAVHPGRSRLAAMVRQLEDLLRADP